MVRLAMSAGLLDRLVITKFGARQEAWSSTAVGPVIFLQPQTWLTPAERSAHAVTQALGETIPHRSHATAGSGGAVVLWHFSAGHADVLQNASCLSNIVQGSVLDALRDSPRGKPMVPEHPEQRLGYGRSETFVAGNKNVITGDSLRDQVQAWVWKCKGSVLEMAIAQKRDRPYLCITPGP